MAKPTIPQPYPRIPEPHKKAGYLDTSKLALHTHKLSQAELQTIIEGAIEYANRKASRAILDIPEKASDEEAHKIYLREGRALFAYFKKGSCPD